MHETWETADYEQNASHGLSMEVEKNMKRHHIGTTHEPKLLQEFRTTLLGKDHCGHSFVRLSLSKIETLILTHGNP